MTQTTRTDALTFLANRPLTPFSTFALRTVVLLVSWEELRRTRRSLKDLDDHLLDDIGMTRFEAQKEAERPFWQI